MIWYLTKSVVCFSWFGTWRCTPSDVAFSQRFWCRCCIYYIRTNCSYYDILWIGIIYNLFFTLKIKYLEISLLLRNNCYNSPFFVIAKQWQFIAFPNLSHFAFLRLIKKWIFWGENNKWKKISEKQQNNTPRGRFELPRREAPVAFEATAFPG